MTDKPLPEEDQKAAERSLRLQAWAESLVTKRDEAISFKDSTGIVAEWDEDDDYYNGKDPFSAQDKPAKGRTTTDGLGKKPMHDAGSDIFDNITAYHVDMRAARATDMLTPTDDKPFAIKPTPMPDVTKARDDPEAAATMMQAPDGSMVPAGQVIDKMLKDATESAEQAETWIWDKFIGFNWHAEFRKCLHEAHKIGNWVMKGPFPVRRKFRTLSRENGVTEVVMSETIEPASKAIDPRNLFPDPACYPAENIQAGSFVWERAEISYRQLAELRGIAVPGDDGAPEPLYLDDQIDECLKEGPLEKKQKDKQYEKNDKDLFTIWYGYVTANQKDMEAAGCKCGELEYVPAQVTLVNDRVIQATLSPLDGGEFPYDILVLERRPGTPWGKGVSRKIRVQQRQINALQRAWMKNAGLSAGPLLFFRRDKFSAADGGTTAIRPFGAYAITDDTVDDIRKVFDTKQIPSEQVPLLQGIQFAIQRANELVGNAPQDQGQQNESPETKGGRLILQNNSNAPQRQIARNADDGVIEPHVKRYYAYWLAHAEGDKRFADHQIEALGSTSMFERDAEQQFLLQVWGSGLANHPDSRIDVNKLTIELAKGNKLNPERIRFTDDEWKARQEQLAKQGPPPIPAVEVAKIREQGANERQQIKSQEMMQKIRADTDRDTLYEQTMATREQTLQAFKERELMLKREIELMKQNSESARLVEELKTKLADTTMKLAMQEKLARIPPDGAPQVVNPPSEPPQRAPNGQAFQQ